MKRKECIARDLKYELPNAVGLVGVILERVENIVEDRNDPKNGSDGEDVVDGVLDVVFNERVVDR